MATAAGPTLPLSRGRRLLFTAVYMGVLTVVGLTGVELISRGLFEPHAMAVYGTSEVVFDRQVGWRGRRNFSALVNHGRYPLPIQLDINADGFRDESWDEKLRRAKEQGARKILILGDSLLYGWANPVDGRLSEQLQARYRLAGRQVEVFNSGIPGFGPHNQLRLLPELLARLKPDQVVLLFCTNDYGDTALPYDYRHPVRVYQPFYDTDGRRVLFNDAVPRRPSLAMRDTLLADLRLWYAVDQFRYAVEDRRYARQGIPNARTAPVHLFAGLLGDAEQRSRFPYVKATMLALYARMAEWPRAAGAGFLFQPSVAYLPPRWERLDQILRADLQARGVRYRSCPDEIYARWTAVLQDGHPNFLFAWTWANAIYSELEGVPYTLDLAAMPQTRIIPSELDLADDTASARFLSMEWLPAEAGGRRMSGPASFLLRHSAPGRSRLDIVASSARPTRLVVLTTGNRELCRFTVGTGEEAHACEIDGGTGEPILFVHLLPETSLEAGAQPLVRSVRLTPVAEGPPHSPGD